MKEVPAFGYILDRAVKALRSDLNQRFKTLELDLTPEQWLLLNKLNGRQEGLSQNQIADDTYKDAPTVSRIIDLLCKKGFTERLPFEGDRRRHKVILTRAGINVIAKVLPEVQSNRDKGWQGLDHKDLADLQRILNTIYANYLDDK